MCRQLTAPWAREKGKTSGSAHFEKYEAALNHQSQLLETGIYTIEDLRAKGLEEGFGWCPYYAARRLIHAASVVVLNYQYVLDPKVSLASSLGGAPSLPGARRQGPATATEPSIVVFDEVRLADQLFAPAMCQLWLLETPSALANEHSIRCIITRHGCSKIPPQRQAPQVSHK
ncbi:unnamed protein product [Cladocopium goreaui]|uniref:General transcription and DNA repair factor IIH helicase subunit XPD (TFIIH subunit XPD) (ERCC2 homolog ) (RAD3 homolog) (UV hypersensitive protein 6) (AtUVH6) (XPD homolog) (AtXPD) n=1 Tax=Cladocopium goreaui TaxID=2562237 RepID=A0A9P1D0R5_9DINO|nr:unnamed protein product [Cladocopium goreaui]